MEKAGTWLLRTITILSFATSIAALLLPKYWISRIADNERSASLALEMLSSAELDYRGNDLDRNGVEDFWTGDVAGLSPMIDRRIAEADAASLKGLSPVACKGYYFQVLHRDRYTVQDYQQDTDRSGRKVHHPDKFGFCAYPARYGITGRATFILNENNAIYRVHNHGEPLLDYPDEEGMAQLLETKSSDPTRLIVRVSYGVAGAFLILGLLLAFAGRSSPEPKL